MTLPQAAECRSCGKLIAWYETKNGKLCPVDIESVKDDKATIFDPNTMISHFATCDNPKRFRKKKGGQDDKYYKK